MKKKYIFVGVSRWVENGHENCVLKETKPFHLFIFKDVEATFHTSE